MHVDEAIALANNVLKGLSNKEIERVLEILQLSEINDCADEQSKEEYKKQLKKHDAKLVQRVEAVPDEYLKDVKEATLKKLGAN